MGGKKRADWLSASRLPRDKGQAVRAVSTELSPGRP